MNRMVSSVLALFIGFVTLMFGLILFIPLTIAALIAGKKIDKAIKMNRPTFTRNAQSSAIEGEYEDVSK